MNIKEYVAELSPTLSGKLFFKFFGFRKQIVLKNLRYVFSNTLTEQEIIKLAQCFYSHIIRLIKESILMRFMSEEKLKKQVIVIGEEHLANLELNKIKGAIILTGHFGNFEFAPAAGILNFKEFRKTFYFIRKKQAIKFIEKIFFKRFFKAGLGIIYKKNSLTEVYQKLEEDHLIVMVMDQHAKGKEGILVDFFGKKTNTYRTVAMIVRDTGVPVIPAYSYRRSDGLHVLEFLPPLTWNKHEDPAEEIYINTRLYNQTLEKMILKAPEQWLWLYNRWKEKH